MALVDPIVRDGKVFAYVLRRDVSPRATTFVTPDHEPLQLGLVVYPKDGVVPRHVHRPIERTVHGTTEVLIVRSGRCELDLYDDSRVVVDTIQLSEGDVVLLVSGGHGLRMHEDTTLLEIKQGPYTGIAEKERF